MKNLHFEDSDCDIDCDGGDTGDVGDAGDES